MTELGDIFSTTPWLLAGCVFLLSLLVGSFLNVVIHRLPIMLDREWRAQARETLDEGTVAADSSEAAARTETISSESATDVETTISVLGAADVATVADGNDDSSCETIATAEIGTSTEAVDGAEIPGPTEALADADADADAEPATSLETAGPGTTDSRPAAPYNLLVPRSRCPHCDAEIKAHQNIPVLSYLLLGGRCASCRAPISARYPIVELLTAVLSTAVALKFGWHWQTLAALLLTWSLIALTAIDLDHTILPDVITLPLLWLGLLLSLAWHAGLSPPAPVDPRSAIVGAIAGYMVLWSVYWAFKLLTGKEGMGYGDFKLFGALGAWLGWQMLPLVLLLSAFTGAVVGIVLIVARGRDRNIPIPFGPYLAAAGWIALMWGPQIVGGYMEFSGLQP